MALDLLTEFAITQIECSRASPAFLKTSRIRPVGSLHLPVFNSLTARLTSSMLKSGVLTLLNFQPDHTELIFQSLIVFQSWFDLSLS